MTESDATPAEAQEIEAAGHYVTADLCGKTLEIIPSGAWRQSSMRLLKANEMDDFFADVLSSESYELYLDLDPTNDELGRFLDDSGAASGEPVGKSSGPSRSQRRTRKR
ncbi:hypothetical protein OHA37_27080 [Streptomyces sp. NBC_00335]|uniref:hypothetical protein n=1 Tax=unclassified Streptomyces TaxID=2593676 RepID=UPI00225332E6|nr:MULTISPECIES: hypothetical protein [unclassified Streptomyces]MCX5407515.1 hypothetical protein [Streptomyces sp. NBC_00086]